MDDEYDDEKNDAGQVECREKRVPIDVVPDHLPEYHGIVPDYEQADESECQERVHKGDDRQGLWM